MRNFNYKFNRSNYEFEGRECPDWLDRFAKEQAGDKKPTAVDVGRQRSNSQQSVVDQIDSIMHGKSKSSVEDRVQEYHQRTGLTEYLKKNIAKKIVAAGEDEEKKTSKPEIVERYPQIETYINNLIETNYGIQLPAVLQSVHETFARDGLYQSDLDDPEFLKYVNNILKNNPNNYLHDHDMNVGKGVGVQHNDVSDSKDSNNDPFSCLVPNKE